MKDLDQFIDIIDLEIDPRTRLLSQLEIYYQECFERLEALKKEVREKAVPVLYDIIALKIHVEIKERAWSQIWAVERGKTIHPKQWALNVRNLIQYVNSRPYE